MGNLGLSIAASGVNAAQTAMDTIAENLSNTNTPGYVNETANLVANPISDSLGIGAGVSVTSVTQPSDGLLLANAQQAQASLAQTSALQQVMQEAQLGFQNPSSSSGLASDLSGFWNSWDALAQNPTDPASLNGVVSSAQTVASDLNQASAQLSTTEANAASQLQSVATQGNTLLGDMAQLNLQIESAQGLGNTPNSLIDERNQIMGQLSTTLGATGSVQSDGSMLVNVAGVTVVQGSWSDTLKATSATSGGSTTWQLVTKDSQATLKPSTGTAAGLLAAINQRVPYYQGQLNDVATSLMGLVNAKLGSGFTAAGAPGTALFQGTSAADIAVVPAVAADPTQLATATSATNAAGDGSNAQAIANLWNSTGGPDATYRGAIQSIGDEVSSLTDQVQAQTSVSNAAQQNLQAVTGVNQNNELVSLMNFQQTYQAAAKVITTVDTAMQSLIAAV